MRKFITMITFGVAFVLVALACSVVKADAAPAVQDSKTVATAVQSTPGVPQITCDTPTACVLAYVGNGDLQGYWMARHFNGTTWVRLTLVAGWDNTYVAPITCAQEDSCVQDVYYNAWRGVGYLMARQSNGTVWVRESMVGGN